MDEKSAPDTEPPKVRIFSILKRKQDHPAATPTNSDGNVLSTSEEADASSNQKPDVAAETFNDAEQEYVSGLQLLLVLGSVVLAVFLVMLDTSIVSTAIPHITTQFHSLEDVGWYGSAYMLASCSLQPLTGKFYNRFSTKIVFLSFFAVFMLGSLICGVAQSSMMFIIGRAIAGMGSSGLFNGGLTIISASVPLIKRPLYIGIMLSISQLGVLLGPLIGGLLTDYASWRWCFYINLPAGGVVAVLLLAIRIPNINPVSQSKPGFKGTLADFDLIGFVFFAPAAIQFLLALDWGGTTYAWDSATVIGLFCGSAGTLCVFLAWEYHRGDTAMIPLSLMKQRIMWSSCLTIAFFFGSMIMYSYYLPMYFQAVRGRTPTMSGVDLLPGIVSQMITAIVAGILVSRIGYYLPFALIGCVLAALCMGLISTFTPDTSAGKWIGYQILGGIGRGCGTQMPMVAVQNLVPKEQIPVSSAIIFFFQSFSGALFLSFAQTLFTASLKDSIKRYAPDVSYDTLAAAGATGFRSVVPKPLIPDIIQSYNQSISHVFYFATASSVTAFVVCWGMGWKNIKKPKTVEPNA